MPDLLLFLLIVLAVLVVAALVLRWAARAERRADRRQLMTRVYYPTRGHKATRARRPWPADDDDPEDSRPLGQPEWP